MTQDSTERTFIHLSRAWYGPANLGANTRYVDEVTLSDDINVRWYALQDDRPPAPKLEAFDDSWAALAKMGDLLAWMATQDNKSITPSDFCRALERLGFTDATPIDEERRADLARKVQELVDKERNR